MYLGLLATLGAWGPLLLFLLFAVMLLLPRALGRHLHPPASDEPVVQPERGPALEAAIGPDVAAEALEMIRRTTNASEAALWLVNGSRDLAHRIEWAGRPGLETGAVVTDLEGHPFAWAVLEQVHVRLERGRKPLPSAWAAEMLLVPLADGERLLALAYPGIVPPEAESAALRAGRHLSEVLELLRVRQGAARMEDRLEALVRAVGALPGELQIERFAERFCEAVEQGTRADGIAMVSWNREGGGEVLHSTATASLSPGVRIGEGESRLALAVKHGTVLQYPDLREERDGIPLCSAAEVWSTLPRSAIIVPLLVEGRCLGAVTAWHHEPDHFGVPEQEFLQLLASIGTPPLQSARRYEALDRRASTDALTGLPNRGSFQARLTVLSHHFSRYGRPFGVVILDIDHFKRFNDTWGHAAGDRVLQHVGGLLRTTLREVDFPARLGGEEFVILLPESNLKESVEAAERVRRSLESRPVTWNGRPLKVTASLGIASCPDTCGTPSQLLDVADAALYRSKEGGRNRVTAATNADLAGA